MNTALPLPWRMYGRTVAVVLAILFTVGAAGHGWPATLPLMIVLTPWFGIVTGLLVVLPSLAAGRWRFFAWAAATYAFTFAAEALGVATGAVFGEYVYGPTMGLAWLDVPLLIAFNWVMVVHGSFYIASRVVVPFAGAWRRPALILLTGLLATGFDFIMEPVAIRLDYWTWAGGAIPLQNYVAWFVIAILSAAFHPWSSDAPAERGSAGRLAGLYVVMQAAFFIAIRLLWRWGGG